MRQSGTLEETVFALSQASGKSEFSVREPRSLIESNYEPGNVYDKKTGSSINKATRSSTCAKEVYGDDERCRKERVEFNGKASIKQSNINSLSDNYETSNDLAKKSWNDLLRVEARILGRKGTILIDCGAQDNFVSKAFVNHLHARTRTLKDVSRVMLPDGRTYAVKEYLPRAKIKVCGGYADNVDLKVVSMQHDVILGKP